MVLSVMVVGVAVAVTLRDASLLLILFVGRDVVVVPFLLHVAR